MRTLLIDADIIAYKIAAREEQAVEWDRDRWTVSGDMAEARVAAATYLEKLREELEADSLILALSDDTNFRKRIFPGYKANRAPERKPVLLAPLKEWLAKAYPSYRRPELEGDDVLGILLTSPHIVKGEKILVSLDKDMKTLPGLHAHMEERDIFEVSPREADYRHMLQTLTGDRTDGYAGCPGVGPAKAEKLLAGGEGVAEWWPIVLKAYEKAKLGPEHALLQARLARILRHTDYDFKRREAKLWQPPQKPSSAPAKPASTGSARRPAGPAGAAPSPACGVRRPEGKR